MLWSYISIVLRTRYCRRPSFIFCGTINILYRNKQILRKLFRRYFELTFWTSALALLAMMPPGSDPHYSFCVFKMLGIHFCPGCGLGHSISYLFRGNIQASFSAHPLGIFAVIIIPSRIYQLLYLTCIFQKQ